MSSDPHTAPAEGGPEPMQPLIDMHCHLDRMANGDQVALEAGELGIGVLCTTVAPEDFESARARFAHLGNVRVAAGLHPWWVEDGPCGNERAKMAACAASQSDYVGEIGLDFSRSHRSTADAQIEAFDRIIAACADHQRAGRLLSIHAVQSAPVALDILERHEMTRQSSCIFHWFSGTSDDLARLRRLGCYISVSERMLATKRGREYARQMPLERLLLETDAPAQLDSVYSAHLLRKSLDYTLNALAVLRSENKSELAARIAQTSSQLLDLQRTNGATGPGPRT